MTGGNRNVILGGRWHAIVLVFEKKNKSVSQKPMIKWWNILGGDLRAECFGEYYHCELIQKKQSSHSATQWSSKPILLDAGILTFRNLYLCLPLCLISPTNHLPSTLTTSAFNFLGPTMVQNNQEHRLQYWVTPLFISSFAFTAHLFTRLLTSLTPSLVEKWLIWWLFCLCFFFFLDHAGSSTYPSIPSPQASIHLLSYPTMLPALSIYQAIHVSKELHCGSESKSESEWFDVSKRLGFVPQWAVDIHPNTHLSFYPAV